MKIIVLGVGDAFSECYYPSSFVVEYNGFYLAVDCPFGYRKILKELLKERIGCHDINHYLITHMHSDHVSGLEGVAFFRYFYELKKTILVSSRAVRESIWDKYLYTSMGTLLTEKGVEEKNFSDYFDHILLNSESSTKVGPFNIEIKATLHHIPTSALRISAGGKMLAYSSDGKLNDEMLEFLSPADLIIHEANVGFAHTSIMQLFDLPSNIKNKIRLIHYYDGFLSFEDLKHLCQGEVINL